MARYRLQEIFGTRRARVRAARCVAIFSCNLRNPSARNGGAGAAGERGPMAMGMTGAAERARPGE
ncbi:MAG TPA: hypothetical protein VN133_08330, partial [Humibacter sp.]|nr:hypothetical protein [Humibacter sp.]